MKGLKEVFVFTLQQQLKIPAVKTLTIVIALLLFLVPAAAMTLTEISRRDDTEADPPAEDLIPEEPFEEINGDGIDEILYVNETSDALGYDLLENAEIPGLEGIRFSKTDSVEAANAAAQGKEGILILLLREDGDLLEALGIVPEGSALDVNKARYAAERTSDAITTLAAEGTSLPAETKAEAVKPFFMDYSGPDSSDLMSEEEQEAEMLRTVAVMILPYINIMLIYFLVLYYGQSSANSVILEKTSKLMDSFLVAVKPESMIFGKVLAEWTAALIQFGAWVLALIGGFSAGTFLVKTINPDSTMGILRLFDFLGGVTKMFALPEVIVSVLMIAAGFFLYCCLAAICASFASKPEELSGTLSIFSILLVVSMLVTIRAGFLNGEMAEGAKWFDFFPFTAILITPSRVLLGMVSFSAGLASLAVILTLSVVFILIAGRVYRAMSLYRGKIPKFPQIIAMLRE
ncbi:MAG: ABC transporter permease [Ruminococcaceae bacterium]|jgi:ABC-type Na+ efflux pump permease subunit|nr:ABC transporter permease [Oscillospiraceae bacterium]